ncbi:MAG TPA: ABC transporter permease [Solirubrobacterales bacterium]|nr:ABC transporter permease [Solirubrobacterales bacterium]
MADRGLASRASIERAFTLRSGWRGFERFATIIGFVAMFAVFWILKPGVFGTWESVKTILDQAAVVVILAVGLTVVMTAGEFDLSFPGLVGLSAVVGVKAMSSGHADPALAVVLALATGLAGGLVAGLLVATKRTSSFITTLALNTVWGGLALGISGGGGSTIVNIPLSYTTITSTRILGITLPVFYALGVSILIGLLLRATVFGRNARAIGENPDAARLSGVRLGVSRTAAFAVMGVCAGMAAVILSSKTAQYTPNIDAGLFIPPFVAAFFGISVLAVGRFNVLGTVVGALFIGTLETGLIVIGSQAWVGEMVVGAALLTILFISAQTREAR